MDTNGKQLLSSATKTLNGWQLKDQMPQILYSSRTHSQLSQACKELKRTSYKSFKSVVIGSREQLCINPDVTKLDTMSAKNQTCRYKTARNMCQYYRNYEQKVERSLEYSAGQVFDIEDLVRFGKSNTCCPYYAAHYIQKSASLVFMPYNYVLDPNIRHRNKLDVKHSVVIFDEGHNIERMCEESVSTELRSHSFAVVIKYMDQLLEKLRDLNENKYEGSDDKELSELDVVAVVKLKNFVCDLEMAMDSMVKSEKSLKITHQTPVIFSILEKAGLEVQTIQALMKTMDELVMLITSSGESGSPQGMAMSAAFNSLKEFVEKLIPIGITTAEAYQSHKEDFIKKYKIFSEKGVEAEDDKTNFWNKQSSPDSWILHVW
jgi:regulator of telomere elongation helicase 1